MLNLQEREINMAKVSLESLTTIDGFYAAALVDGESGLALQHKAVVILT